MCRPRGQRYKGPAPQAGGSLDKSIGAIGLENEGFLLAIYDGNGDATYWNI